MKNLAKGAALLAAILLLAGCATIQAGTITDKRKSGGYWYTTTICTPTSNGGVSCVPQMHYMPETRSFHLDDGEEDGWIGVSEDTYHDYEVGDYVDFRD